MDEPSLRTSRGVTTGPLELESCIQESEGNAIDSDDLFSCECEPEAEQMVFCRQVWLVCGFARRCSSVQSYEEIQRSW